MKVMVCQRCGDFIEFKKEHPYHCEACHQFLKSGVLINTSQAMEAYFNAHS
jgi:hypothetical protein